MTVRKCFVFRFDDVELRDREFVLAKGSEVLPVEPKAFRVLQYLLRHPQKLITKDELMDAVWSDVAVSENSVARAIAQLRRLLGDDIHEPRYIATVPTVGYRFICNVEASEDLPGNGRGSELVSASGEVHVIEAGSGPNASTSEVGPQVKPPPEVNPERRDTSKRDHRGFWRIGDRRLKIVLAACASCILLIGSGTYLLKPPPPRVEGFRFGPFGVDVASPLWSPDGKAIVYVAKITGRDQLFLRYLNSPVGIQLTHLPHNLWGKLAPLGWSNDRSHVLFAKQPDGLEPFYRIYSVATVGGAVDLIMDSTNIEGCGGLGTLSPDGKVLVLFAQGNDGTYGLEISNPLGTPPRPYLPAPFATKDVINRPALRFSPDGKKMLFIIDGEHESRTAWLLPYPAGSKPPRRLLQKLSGFDATPSFDWMPDSRHIVISMAMNQVSPLHLWMMDTESADMTPLTGGSEGQISPIVAPHGKSVIYAQPANRYSVISVSVIDGSIKPLIDAGREESMASWSVHPAKLVWVSNRNGPYEIWLRDTDGTERPVVTAAEFPPGTNKWFLAPALSPDGERIVYRRFDNNGIDRLWISSLTGGEPVRLTNVEPDAELGGSWSPAGDRFVYVQVKRGEASLMTVKATGNATPSTLRDLGRHNSTPDWSRSGHWITFLDDNGWNLISPDGKASKFLGKITTQYLTFSRDEKLLYGIHLDDTGPDPYRGILFSLDPLTLQQKAIKDLGESMVPDSNFSPGVRFSFGPDGKSFVYTINKSQTDWWILDGLPLPDWRGRLRAILRFNFGHGKQ
jgi:Tol biopolymer transport system component/DNA-binding winged helix-turn-helix (wHTH) protein